MAKRLEYPTNSQPALTLNQTLTSGITLSAGSTLSAQTFSYGKMPGVLYDRITFGVSGTLTKNIPSDAALAFGEHLATFPAGYVKPLGCSVYVLGSCPTGLSATAGEVGVGTTIASGAVATLGGTPAFENLMEGTTIANHVAATPLSIYKANDPIIAGTHSATVGSGAVLDARAGTTKIHINIASTWDQTATENYSFSGYVDIFWQYLGAGA